MLKYHPMSNDDDNEFMRAMHGVKPLQQDTHKQHRDKPSPKRRHQPPTPKLTPYVYDINLLNTDDWVSGDEKVSFKQAGVQKKTIDNLKRGMVPWEARIDLHHHTAGEAMAVMDHFIEHARSEGLRSLLVIHGKGSMSRSDKPILKNILTQHLRQSSNVIAYHSARPRDGGTGALYVLLKANTKV